MRCLITGSSGFIGGHLFEELNKRGALVAGADIKNKIDIRSYNFHEKYDVIFHTAAQASIPASFKNPLESHTHNVVGTLRILEYARATGAMVVFSSSSSVYGDAPMPTSESQPPDPMSPYAFQKLIGEGYCDFYWTLGVKSVALRYFNVFGERQPNTSEYSTALGEWLDEYKNGKSFKTYGDGEQRRDWIYVKDVVDANIRAAEFLQTATEFQAINIGSGKNYSVNEVIAMIDNNYPREYMPSRIEPIANCADITKARELLNWNPQSDLKDWLKTI